MHFDASVKRLQDAVKNLEKASKAQAKSAKKEPKISSNQIDMFATSGAANCNQFDVQELKSQLDDAIETVETLLKESA